tara:strand:- start:11753 stop:12544 length:792 start_codon:yes stop_codon:yes gene_type:complete
MKHWQLDQSENVVVARFSNPPMGYFCAHAAQELGELIEAWQAPDIRAIVLTGQSGRFITHYSVEELVAFGEDDDQMEEVGTALSDGYHDLLQSLGELPKPVIAAITGDCMGGGFELAMWCDIRIIGTGDYRLGLPEILLGIMPGGSGTQKLTALVGPHLAREMILTGTILTPHQALERGVVHRVEDDPVSASIKLARQFRRRNPRAVANIKAAIAEADTTTKKGLHVEAECFLDTMRHPNALATMKAYLSTPANERRDWLLKQ